MEDIERNSSPYEENGRRGRRRSQLSMESGSVTELEGGRPRPPLTTSHAPIRKGKVYYAGTLAGLIEETSDGYRFEYDPEYLATPGSQSISATMPKRREPYISKVLFPFFFGLLAEGILKETQCRKLKLDENDHFGRLLKTGHSDTIGAVTVVEEEEA